MNTLTYGTSACQFCRYYQLQGRRGGMCQQLGVPVKAGWKACSLALPPFAPSWERLEEIWQDNNQLLKPELAVNCARGCSDPNYLGEKVGEKSISTAETLTADMVLV